MRGRRGLGPTLTRRGASGRSSRCFDWWSGHWQQCLPHRRVHAAGLHGCRSLSQEEEAKNLVSEAIAAGIFNDLGSGSNIDLCVISKSKLDFLRPYSVPNKKGTR